ncbi:MAG: DHA1 family multidrug resistance protein-like MFS transporter [Candidatus Paceibacteria bacterium]|jgi:DHA1 family multidrug resistance protein-like MFS transporter
MGSWKRTYWVVWIANFVTALGMMSFLVFFPSHLAKLGVVQEKIPLWTGMIFGAAPLVASIMTPIWSAIGDRYGRRLMTIRSMLAITVFVGAMSFATEPWHLLLLRLGQGCFSGFIAPSITLVSVVAPPDRQGFVAGSLQTAMALGAIIGPLLGASILQSHGLETVFVGVACASFCAALLVGLFAEERASDRIPVKKGVSPLEILQSSLRDLADVWANPRMRKALVLLFWMLLAVGATSPLMEIYVRELSGPETNVTLWTGALTSAFAATNLVAMPAWGHLGDRRGHAPALRRCALLALGALVLNAAALSLSMLFVARILLAASMAGSSSLPYGLAAQEVPVNRRGGAMGAVFSARTLAVACSAMVGGACFQWVGMRGLILLGAILLGVMLVRTREASSPTPPGAD